MHTLLDWVREGGLAGEPVRGEGTSSSASGDAGDVGNCADGTRLATIEPARLLTGARIPVLPINTI
jgi:hypothetical protein